MALTLLSISDRVGFPSKKPVNDVASAPEPLGPREQFRVNMEERTLFGVFFSGCGSKRKSLGTTGFGLFFLFPIGFFRVWSVLYPKGPSTS